MVRPISSCFDSAKDSNWDSSILVLSAIRKQWAKSCKIIRDLILCIVVRLQIVGVVGEQISALACFHINYVLQNCGQLRLERRTFNRDRCNFLNLFQMSGPDRRSI